MNETARLNELRATLKDLEDKQWWLAMADRWTPEERDYNQKLTTQIIAVKNEIRKLEQ